MKTKSRWRTLSSAQKAWISEVLRNETLGGVLLLAAAISALIIANSPVQHWFFEVKNLSIGFPEIDLKLSIGSWASDGLLALFFLAAGIELKHELVHGSLKERKRAIIPVAAALGGMLVPALVFALFNRGTQSANGWGIPMATDIAFALAILAVVGRKLPIELRAFLLTLAVVDDLGAIIVIAIFYSSKFAFAPFLGAFALLALFGYLQRRRVRGWYFYVPLALLIWYFVHASGIHATVAGVAMGLLVNLRTADGEKSSPGDKLLHRIHPYSALIAVPVFAFFSSGISLAKTNLEGFWQSTLTLGIVVGLVVGKPVGVFLGAWLSSKLTSTRLSNGVSWWDIASIGSLAGVGFTVALLIGELAFKGDQASSEQTVMSILTASLISALIASTLLLIRGRIHRRSQIA